MALNYLKRQMDKALLNYKNYFPSVMGIGLLLSCLLFCHSSYAATYEEGIQAYLNKDYTRALEILRPLAEQGDSQAQIAMGLIYDYGYGVEKNPSESIKWYRMAAEQGAPLAQHDLGVKYFQGQGVEQDHLEAAKWWKMSADAGIADSQFSLGLMYYQGIGIDKDFSKAANLFERAAEQGHRNAQYSLAVMYTFGQGKEKDYTTALKWFRKAANQNLAQAQFNLGVFYEKGYAVDEDIRQAVNWYTLAAEQGLQEATEKLEVIKTKALKKEQAYQDDTNQAEKLPGQNMATVSTSPDSLKDEFNLSNWLRQQTPDNYMLQLASVVNKDDIIKFIKASNFDQKAGYIEVIVNDVIRYTAVYGLYDSYKKAELAINDLPDAIRESKPWVRNTGILQGILR